MNKITLIENNETQSDFIVDFPLKDIAVDGKSIRETKKICKQLRIICWVFGMFLALAFFYQVHQNRKIINSLELPKLTVGDKIYFTDKTVGHSVAGKRHYLSFKPGVEHEVSRVGAKQQHFRIILDGIEYKFHNARDSLIKINE